MYILLLQNSQCNPVKIAFAAAVAQILKVPEMVAECGPFAPLFRSWRLEIGSLQPCVQPCYDRVYILSSKQCQCEICCDDCVNSICTDGHKYGHFPQCDPSEKEVPLYRSSRRPNRTSRAPIATFCLHLLCRTSPIAPPQLNSSRPQICNPRNDQDAPNKTQDELEDP